MPKASIDHPQIRFVPFEEAAKERNYPGFTCVSNMWWITHPARGLVLWSSREAGRLVPQCNKSEAMTKGVCEHLFEEGFEAKFLEVAYIPDC